MTDAQDVADAITLTTPVNAANSEVPARVTVNNGEQIMAGPGIFNVLDYGAVADSGTTDNSAAFQAAIDAAAAVNGRVFIPAASGWYEAHGLDLDGAWGITIEGEGEGSQIRNTGGSESVFLIGYVSTLSNAVFRNFRVISTVAGKACFEIDGMYSCRFENVMMNSYVATARNVMSNTVTGWTGIFDCTWSDCAFSCDGVAQSVPIFDIVDVDSDKFNSNTIRGGRVTGSATATSVLFSFSSQNTNSYHYQNTLQGINFEIPNYGAILIEGGNGWTLDTIGGYDMSATQSGSFIKIAKHASGNESVGCHIVNCTNVSLQSRGSFYDIETQGDYHTIINSGGHNTSGKLDFNDELVTIIGCSRSALTGTANATIVEPDYIVGNKPTLYTTGATLTIKDRLVLADFATAQTLTLPAISTLVLPHSIVIFAIGSANATVDPGTDNIDGSTTDKVITGGSAPPGALALAVYNATDDWVTLSEQGTVT